jgi:hypothetical protein
LQVEGGTTVRLSCNQGDRGVVSYTCPGASGRTHTYTCSGLPESYILTCRSGTGATTLRCAVWDEATSDWDTASCTRVGFVAGRNITCDCTATSAARTTSSPSLNPAGLEIAVLLLPSDDIVRTSGLPPLPYSLYEELFGGHSPATLIALLILPLFLGLWYWRAAKLDRRDEAKEGKAKVRSAPQPKQFKKADAKKKRFQSIIHSSTKQAVIPFSRKIVEEEDFSGAMIVNPMQSARPDFSAPPSPRSAPPSPRESPRSPILARGGGASGGGLIVVQPQGSSSRAGSPEPFQNDSPRDSPRTVNPAAEQQQLYRDSMPWFVRIRGGYARRIGAALLRFGLLRTVVPTSRLNPQTAVELAWSRRMRVAEAYCQAMVSVVILSLVLTDLIGCVG